MPRRGLVAALSIGLCVVATAAPSPAYSQSREVRFNVPAGDLKTALDTFNRQAGVPIIYQGSEMNGVRTRGYRGSATPRAALAALLNGTGFQMHFDPSGAIAVAKIRRAQSDNGRGRSDAADESSRFRAATKAQLPRDIVVTGTRIVRAGYDAPTPTTVLQRELLEAKSPTTAIDALVSLPVFRASSSPTTAGVAQAGPSGQSFVNMRGLGATRTLVLFDGQRFVPSTSVGTVDIGVLPTALVQRVDIVTGGASAAYGSDAVAGVVNFVIDNRLTGVKGAVEGGISAYGDNRSIRAELSAGTSFAADGHIVISGEYVKASGVPFNARPDTEYPIARVLTNRDWTPDNGQFRRLILPYVYTRAASLGGVVVDGPLAGLEFGPNGTTSQQPTGIYIGTSNHALAGRFDGQAWDLSLSLSALPQEKAAGYARVSWDFARGLTAYATGIVARNKPGPFYSSPANTIISGNFVVQRDNAFLPQAVSARMAELSLQTINVGRYSEDFGASIVSRTNDTYRGVLGLEGSISSGWKIDAYGQFGENRQVFLIERNWIKANIALAADAVDEGLFTNGVANGTIVCRSTITDRDNGCIPLNIFGPTATRFAPVAPAAADYIFATSRAVLRTEQTVAALSISGQPLHTSAGPVSIVAGAEFRRETARQSVDALSRAGAFGLGNPKPLSGAVSTREVFAETVVPLAKDAQLLQLLEFNGAVRITDYSTSGSVATWKAGLTWAPTEDLLFRVTQSRDIRAPNILELFNSPVLSTGAAVDPFTNTAPTFQISSLGNPDLRPERADTIAAGVVVRPAAFPGLALSVDYYRIAILHAISTLTPADIVSRCYSGNADLCQLVSRTDGVITRVDNPYLNLQSITASGVDLELSYRHPVGQGIASARVLANWVHSYTVSDGVTTVERAGDVSSGLPRTAVNAMFGYAIGDFKFHVDVTHIGGGNYDNTFSGPYQINDNRIPARTTLGLQASWDIGSERKREIFFSIANVFNTRPPASFVLLGGPNYERIGTAFKSGVRFEL